MREPRVREGKTYERWSADGAHRPLRPRNVIASQRKVCVQVTFRRIPNN
jgi:hypothetical protein